jgi:inhibitor of KinA
LSGDVFRVVAAGDSTLIVELADRLDAAVNDRAVSLADALTAARIAGVRDVVPTFRTVAIHFDPLQIDQDRLMERVRGEAVAKPVGPPRAADVIRVPVCYGGEYGPDLHEVAKFGGTSEAEAVALHAAITYRVFMLGFCPGFAYMARVDERIAAPRLPVPRVLVPAGSVGIAGAQTAIYPFATPGGWRVIGRSPVVPFDVNRPEPCLFKPGDTVKFYPIDEAEYRAHVR